MGLTAILLAAGASRRFGDADKLLADWGDGMPVAVRVLRALDCEAVDTVIAVVRPDGAELAGALSAASTPGRLIVVVNEAPDRGLASSLVAGLTTIPGGASGLIVTPADLPGLTSATVRRLAHAYAADGSRRVAYAALPDGSQRNPVVWPPRLWPALAKLTGDAGGKTLIAKDADMNGAVAVTVQQSDELSDIDTPQDLARFTRRGG